MKRNFLKTLFLFFVCMALILFGYGTEQEKKEKEEAPISINQWLIAGPASLPLPVVLGEGAEFSVKNLFDLDILDPLRLWVKEGDKLEWSPKNILKWSIKNVENGKLTISAEGTNPQVVFLACYLDSSRWQKIKVEIETHHLLKVFLDGVSVITRDVSSKSDAKEIGKATGELMLSQGKHRLFITAIRDPNGHQEWSIKATFKPKKEEYLSVSLATKRTLTEDDIFNSLNLRSISISPDGKAVAYTVSQRNPRTKKHEYWIEIRKLPDGEIEKVIRDTQNLRNLRWSPDGKFLSAIAPGTKDTFDLWLIERKTGQTQILLDDVKGLNNAIWSPTGEFMVYSVTDEPKEKEQKIQRMTGLQDRWIRYWPYKTHLYMLMMESKIKRRLTAGTLSSEGLFSSAGNPISPDGNKIIFIKSQPDYKNRPYLKTELVVLDIMTNKAEKVFTSNYSIGSVSFSPDGKKIYFIGGQSIGNIKKEKVLLNDYDRDLYILNPETGEVKSLTDKFNPSIYTALWRKNDSIYLLSEDKSEVQLYRTDEEGKHFYKLNTGVDVVREFDVPLNGSRVVYSGESIQAPIKLFTMDVKNESSKLIYAPDEERWSDVIYGKIEDFNFKNSRGNTIEGWIYYPVDFDPNKKYPLIVYYYGGTSPTIRSFNTRFLQYASNGYFVYVLNPSGATGYGPKFSNFHVNDWGKIVTEEIISGVTNVIKSKPFIDSKSIGAFGGSYGGFMTESLAYKTGMFRALTSLYGISNITSYWGAGWWGFLYSGIATAESFPWNRPDIYVERSPIFHAHKINTPLLLLHGDADINVPITESEQLYTALKLLDKEVEFIRFKDEDHGIRGSDENQRAVPEIMMAWWDKYLKNQPEAWDNLWKKQEK
ncbi:MAG: S9 family peptidase [Acidobacteriota bacterium]